MNNKSLISVIVAASLSACGGGDDELKNNTRGSIEIIGTDFFAGASLSISLSDPDGIKEDSVTYAWSDGSTGPSYTITEADEGSAISVSARYTDDAGFTEGAGASTPTILPTLNLTASIVKGPVEGATCEVFRIDENGEAVLPSQATATSDATGEVSFTDVHIADNGLLSCTGGTYIDESTGATLDAPQLRSVVKVVEDGGVSTDEDGNPILDADGNEVILPAPVYVVSPLTELVVQNTATDLNNFEDTAETINARFGIRFDTTEVAPTVVGTDALGAEGAEEADRYGSVLALISQLDADNTDDDISTVIEELATDIADGSFSEEALLTLETAQTNLETTSQVASFVDSTLLGVIGASVGYNNDPVTAIIEGELNGVVRNTSETPLTGKLTIIDPNFNEDAFIEQADVVLTYGTFSIDAEGNWTYTVDTTNDTVASLATGDSVKDPITIESADGTTAVIEPRVAALTQVAQILNTTGSDTGEIRFSVDNLRQGKLNASFSKTVALGSNGSNKDAYITLYGSSGSSSESLIDLRIQGSETDDLTGEVRDPRFLVRNTDNAAYTNGIIEAEFIEDHFYDVEISWDLDAEEQITVTIDGEVLNGGSFSTAAVVDSDFTNLDQWFADGVQTIQFRFGDNGSSVPFGSFSVDNVEVFSDTSGTTSVFSDDFENYELGDDLTTSYGLSIYTEVAVFDAGDGTEEPVPAVFFDLTGRVASNEATPLTGTVSVLDPNTDEASLMASTLTGTYGDLTILADGSWTYILDTTDATIAALVVGANETDTFTIESVDGTTADLVITITGSIVVNTGDNNVARMADTSLTADAELRLTTDGLAEGSISATLKIQAIEGFTATPDVSEDNTVYVSVYGGSASSSNLTGEIVFSNGAVKYRDASKSQQTIEGLTYFDDTDIDVVIEWTATGYSLSIDGGTTFYGPYLAINTGTATETYQVRIGSSSKESAKELLADDIVIADATGTALLSEDFETYTDGEDLSSSYSSSAESTVRTIAGVGANLVARMADTSLTADAELRMTTDALAEGSIAATIKLQAIEGFTATPDVSEDNTAYISVYGGSASSSNLTGEIVFSNGAVKYRDASKSQQTIEGLTYFDDTDIDVVIEWTATGYSLSIDGGTTFYGPYLAINTGTPTETYQVRIGSSSKESAKELLADNIVIADAAGTSVLSEDFETYVVDDDLSTVYSSSAEATVQEK
jgi:VCBS repeat-containing protein